jgi:hypothetical protein
MKIIITESQSESLKEKLQKLVRTKGINIAILSVGKKNLLKIGFNDDPVELLDFIFTGLHKVSAENLDSTYFIIDNNGDVIMQWQYRLQDLYVSQIIYDLLSEFDLDDYDIKEMISEWVGKKFRIIHPAIEFTNYFSEDIDV